MRVRNADRARTERRRKNIWLPSKFSFDCKHPASRSGKARTRTTKINLYIAARGGRGHGRVAAAVGARYPQLRHIYSCHRAHGGSDDYPRPSGKARRRKKIKIRVKRKSEKNERAEETKKRRGRAINGDVCGRRHRERGETRFRG